MSVGPTITITDEFGDTLSVWPAIPGAELNPSVQIDRKNHILAVYFTKEEAQALADAILKAAELTE
jgi:hypothetical protein